MKLLEKTPKYASVEVMFCSHETFAGLCSLDFKNQTFSQHHFHYKFRRILDFSASSEILKKVR